MKSARAPVRDVGLRAVDDPVVAVADGARLDARDVGAGVGLGDAETRDLLAADRRLEVVLLLVVRAELEDRRGRHVGVDGDPHRQPAAVAAGHLLGEDDAREVVAALAAVLLRHRQAEEAELAHALEHPVRVGVLLPLHRVGRELLGDERGERLAQLLVLVVEDEVALARAEVRLQDVGGGHRTGTPSQGHGAGRTLARHSRKVNSRTSYYLHAIGADGPRSAGRGIAGRAGWSPGRGGRTKPAKARTCPIAPAHASLRSHCWPSRASRAGAASGSRTQPDTRTLRAAGVPFTFEYPPAMAESQGARDGVVAGVSAGPRDYVAIRAFAPRALRREALGRELQLRMLDSGTLSRTRRERHAGRPMLVARVRDTERPRADRRVHVFTAGDRSWSIECRRTRARAPRWSTGPAARRSRRCASRTRRGRGDAAARRRCAPAPAGGRRGCSAAGRSGRRATEKPHRFARGRARQIAAGRDRLGLAEPLDLR